MTTIHLRASAGSGIRLASPRVAPLSFRIWRAGDNPGDYGSCRFTARAAASVMAAYEARGGNLLPIDIEHNTNPKANPALDPSAPPRTGGYTGLRLVDTDAGPELWADPVRWSDFARAQIEGGERGYISPDWALDGDTREPIRLNKISLVMEPATYGINLLASASAARRNGMDKDLMMALLKAAQAAASGATDGDFKAMAGDLATQLTDRAKAMGVDPATTTDAGPTSDAAGARAAALPGASDAKDAKDVTASATAGKGLSMGDVQRAIREENAKRDLLAANAGRPGLTDGLVQLLASKSLAEVREIVGALPPKPPTVEKVALVALTASAAAVTGTVTSGDAKGASPEEQGEIRKLHRQLGVDVENVTAARGEAEKGTLGVLSVKRLEGFRADAKKRPAKP